MKNLDLHPTLSDNDNLSLTPFHWACFEGHLSLVKWFIEIQDIPPDYCEKGKHSALGRAALKGHLKIVEYLIHQKKASLTLADRTTYGYTPFHWACQGGHLPLVKWFVENGLNPNYCEPHRHSVIAQAAIAGHLDILKYLVKQGGSPTLPDKTKPHYTPLHWACRYGRLSIIKWLIPLWAETKGALDFNPFIDIARKNQHTSIVEYFLIQMGSQLTEDTELFLKERKRTDTIKVLKEIDDISVFIKRGFNPFLSLYRLHQVHKSMKQK